jgi:hypothetical protein
LARDAAQSGLAADGRLSQRFARPPLKPSIVTPTGGRCERLAEPILDLGGTRAISASAAFCETGWWVADAFAANLSAGLLGALLTVSLVDRAAERRTTAERKRVERLGFVRIRRTVNRVVDLLATMIKAATCDLSDAPRSVEEL